MNFKNLESSLGQLSKFGELIVKALQIETLKLISWSLSGICWESVRRPSRVWQESVRSLSGVYQESGTVYWDSVRSLLGVHQESLRSPLGIHQGLIRGSIYSLRCHTLHPGVCLRVYQGLHQRLHLGVHQGSVGDATHCCRSTNFVQKIPDGFKASIWIP